MGRSAKGIDFINKQKITKNFRRKSKSYTFCRKDNIKVKSRQWNMISLDIFIKDPKCQVSSLN